VSKKPPPPKRRRAALIFGVVITVVSLALNPEVADGVMTGIAENCTKDALENGGDHPFTTGWLCRGRDGLDDRTNTVGLLAGVTAEVDP